MSGIRRDRSRSPTRGGSGGRRRDRSLDRSGGDISNNILNQQQQQQQMMMANMFPQGMMMAGGMYPNMMMPNHMMGGVMSQPGMEMMTATGMEMVPQTTLDMSTMGTQNMQNMTSIQNMPNMQGMHNMQNTSNMQGMQNMQNMQNLGNMSNIPSVQTMPNIPSIPPPPPAPMEIGMMGGMMMDPAMMGMYSNMGAADMAIIPEQKEIVLKHCKLSPPTPDRKQPSRRPRPPGCRTIFVGGLPEKIRESVVREVFENYGRIHTLRLSTKGFCHIRYDTESSVDAAMAISGFRIKLIGKDQDDASDDDDSKATTGWLHVDFALSRDDQNEFERRQRQVIRQQEAQMQQLSAQQQALNSTSRSTDPHRSHKRSPSPLRVQPFSHGAVLQLSEKIKSEDNFGTALPTLLTWLERGECSKKNSTQFYSMIQATNSHIRRLFNEKMQAEEELQECRDKIKMTIQKVIEQLEQVAKVFAAATHQRVWDHFTKPQRKNIETWQKMTQEFNTLKEEFMEKFDNDDDYNNGFNMRSMESGNNTEEFEQLRSENESLKFQLEAYKNEVEVIKHDTQKEMEKFKAQYIARQALMGTFDKKPPLPPPQTEKIKPPPPEDAKADVKVNLTSTVDAGCGEAKLIGVISSFLQVHPQGASLDYVVSYVRAMFPQVTQGSVHHVLQKHTDVFQRTTTGVGANIEHRWYFVCFHQLRGSSINID